MSPVATGGLFLVCSSVGREHGGGRYRVGPGVGSLHTAAQHPAAAVGRTPQYTLRDQRCRKHVNVHVARPGQRWRALFFFEFCTLCKTTLRGAACGHEESETHAIVGFSNSLRNAQAEALTSSLSVRSVA